LARRIINVRWPPVSGTGMGRIVAETVPNFAISPSCVCSIICSILMDKNRACKETVTVMPHQLTVRLSATPAMSHLFTTETTDTNVEIKRDRAFSSPIRIKSEVLLKLKSLTLSLLTNCVLNDNELFDAPLLSLGMNSLEAAELAIAASEVFDEDLPQTLVYLCPSLSSIADLLCHRRQEVITERLPELDPRLTSQEELVMGSICPLLAPVTIQSAHKDSEYVHPTMVREEVAIVGLSIEFPHGISNLRDLDNHIHRKSLCVSRSPWDAKELAMSSNAFIADDIAHRARYGHFMKDHQFAFDGSKFRISSTEASEMHSTQKLLLSISLRALEDSGLIGEKSLRNTGVFVGISGQVCFVFVIIPLLLNTYLFSRFDHLRQKRTVCVS
jgi:acyl carrier protein